MRPDQAVVVRHGEDRGIQGISSEYTGGPWMPPFGQSSSRPIASRRPFLHCRRRRAPPHGLRASLLLEPNPPGGALAKGLKLPARAGDAEGRRAVAGVSQRCSSARRSDCAGRAARRRGRRGVPPPGVRVDPQRRQGRRGALALLVDELHPAQKRRGELVQPGVPLDRLLEAGLPVAPRPVRQVGLVLVATAPPARSTAVGPATRRR